MKHDISMVRGDTLAFGMEFTGLDQDLDSAYFTVRKTYTGSVLFQKSIGSGISKVEENKYRVRIAPEDTEDLNPGIYKYDLEVSANGDVFTILIGDLNLKNDVTR